jgi:hypothetical protein
MTSLTLPGDSALSSSGSDRHEQRIAEASRRVTAVSFRKFGFSLVESTPIDHVR